MFLTDFYTLITNYISMSNGGLKSILMATTLLLLMAVTLSAGCIGGSDETKSGEPTPQVPLDITYDGDFHKKI